MTDGGDGRVRLQLHGVQPWPLLGNKQDNQDTRAMSFTSISFSPSVCFETLTMV